MKQGWGGYPQAVSNAVRTLTDTQQEGEPRITTGCMRSYGDAAMAVENGVHLNGLKPDYFLDFNTETGVLHCTSGVTLHTILQVFIPKGWFLPSIPGTGFVSIGGAIANDVHGKNHAKTGSFGDHVLAIELLRSDNNKLWLDENSNPELFRATIGGVGLTGVIVSAKIKLSRIESAYFDVTSIKYAHLNEFFDLSTQHENAFDYNVAWIDCLAPANALGRGHFIFANHAAGSSSTPLKINPSRKNRSIAVTPPISLINQMSIKAFNTLYYHRQRSTSCSSQQYYEQYLFPLDKLHHWNRLYGKRGFVQHQCVIPNAAASEAISRMLELIRERGSGSFLAVLKRLGNRASKGMLSFPRPGITLALDFSLSASVLKLLNELDAIVRDHEGAIYLAKDARMERQTLVTGYPMLDEFSRWVDPAMASLMSERLGIT